MHYAKSFFLGFALVGLAACSGGSDDSTTSPGSNAPSSSENGTTTPNPVTPTPNDPKPNDPKPNDPKPNDPKPTCNTITNDATPITFVEVVAQNAPTPTGGAMANGTYHLTAITLYAGPSGKGTKIPLSVKNTVKVSGNVVDQVFDGTKNGGEVVAEKSTETFSVTGTTVTYTGVCPNNKSRTGTYSVDGATMTLFLKNDVGQTVGYVYAP